MPLTFADIESESSGIRREVNHLSALLQRVRENANPSDGQTVWEVAHTCASATEKIYTGCERVMATPAKELDFSPVSHPDGWHSTLLQRMANPLEGVRGAIISTHCFALLDRLRSFRHRERNTYGFDLDFEIVLLRGHEAITAFSVFRAEVAQFLDGELPFL